MSLDVAVDVTGGVVALYCGQHGTFVTSVDAADQISHLAADGVGRVTGYSGEFTAIT